MSRPVNTAFIGQNRELLRLVAQVNEMNRLLATVRQALPAAMAPFCIAASLEHTVLQLGVTSPAVAARVKQGSAMILDAVNRAGWQATAIRTRVQVGLQKQKAKRSKDLTLSDAALSAFDQLSHTVSDDALRHTLDALVRRHKKR
ncbi:DciA family protein [Chitinibacteraceae bacterium HSL-7]